MKVDQAKRLKELEQENASVIRLNPAIRERVKSGHRERQKT